MVIFHYEYILHQDGYGGIPSHQNRRSLSHLTADENSLVWAIGEAENRIKNEYEAKIEELKRNQMNEYHEMKEKHNDHVEVLLNKLSEANLRYLIMKIISNPEENTVILS